MTEKNHVLRPSGISLGRWLAAAALCLFSVSSWASFPATHTNPGACTTAPCYANYRLASDAPYSFTNGPAACARLADKKVVQNPGYYFTVAPYWVSDAASTCFYTGGMPGYSQTAQAATVYKDSVAPATPEYSCPVNSTLSGTTCTCNAGSVESGSSCSNADGQYWADLLNSLQQTLAGEGGCGVSRCFQGFTVTASGGTCWKDKSTGKNMYENYGPYTSANVPCTATPSDGGASQVEPPATSSPSDCNGYWGSVNGVDTCVPKGTSPATGTATNDSKSTTTTDSTGTTTTTRDGVTVCENGTCTTTRTTTTTAPGGTPQIVTSSSSQPKVGFCQENPTTKACQAADPCDDNPDSVACMKTGTPTEQTLPGEEAGINAVTAVSFTAAAGCPADLSFDVNGSTYAFSYAVMCNTASGYGSPVVLVLGAALAAFVFIGGFKA
jgi:hypothetical protein